MVNVEWALRRVGAAQCLILEHESLESNESLTPRGGFVFPQITQIFTDF